MRCPKCGYISFDHLEACKKCGKNIGEISSQLDGTVYDSISPVFLQFALDESAAESSEEMSDVIEDVGVVEAEENPDIDIVEEVDLDEAGMDDVSVTEELEFDFAETLDEENDGISLKEALDDVDLESDELGEIPPREEVTLDLGGEEGGEVSEGLQLDFSDIDISDLAPPADETTPKHVAEALTQDAQMQPGPSPAAAAQAVSGLEDLQLDGLDLESSATPVAGSVAGRKLTPSVKTGTALDDFDIDLGDLLAEKKK
ncbi:MAG: hypothetical protein GQ559_11620 [Desulfobulbaceae bacterium]|nr:hypothetical protein [Desulfobulbaceae bacterium]